MLGSGARDDVTATMPQGKSIPGPDQDADASMGFGRRSRERDAGGVDELRDLVFLQSRKIQAAVQVGRQQPR